MTARFQNLIAITILLLSTACGSNEDYAIISENDFPSPDNSLIARIIVETYFNTTGYEKRVTLRRKGERPRKATLVERGGPGDEVRVRWQGSTNLVIRYHTHAPQTTAPRQPKNLLGIAITFESIPDNEARGENGYEPRTQ